MTAATDTLDELEELLDLEVPCGGNLSPVERPCPAGAAAIVVATHRCDFGPTDFKCLACFTEWLLQSDYCQCTVCGLYMPQDKVYVPL